MVNKMQTRREIGHCDPERVRSNKSLRSLQVGIAAGWDHCGLGSLRVGITVGWDHCAAQYEMPVCVYKIDELLVQSIDRTESAQACQISGSSGHQWSSIIISGHQR